MKNKQIIGMVVAAGLFIAIGCSSVLVNTYSNSLMEESLSETLLDDTAIGTPLEDYIAIVDVSGTIQEQTQTDIFSVAEGYQHNDTMEYIDRLIEDPYNQGILLYVDSPGGTVYESEELYWKLKEYKEETGCPIWEYMAHYAASGGYMISMNSDMIYANPNTTTGSIGVIMAGYDMTGLYEKLGIRYVSITSGANKDSSQLSESQIAIYQSQVDECYNKFVSMVAEGRNMSEEEVRKLADGRTYTAQQALNNGLIDEIALYEDVLDAIASETGIDVFYEPQTETDIFMQLFSEIKESLPKSESQVLLEAAESMESGVLMYYAEQ
ncbi:MAG: signal peptide peptidase SppA [Schaedlerella sp.]|nr:signal peptide peptidase SppA [Schaedlerella sp.]